MTQRLRRLRLILGAAILICAAPAFPQAVKKPASAAKTLVKPALLPNSAFTLECTGTRTSQVNFTWGARFDKTVQDARQTFVIDPVAMTIVSQYGYISENQPWGIKPLTSKISHITPAGRIVYCDRTDGKPCVKATSTTEANGRTAFVTVGQTIIDMVEMNWKRSGMFAVNKDNSLYVDLHATRGDCKRV
ncbi:MAG: hypothetical protein ACKOUT_06830 [Novosphingobium sp.]